MYKNAFIAGPSVCGDDFFGRKKEIHTILSHMNSGSSVLLIGIRRIGKTSILFHLDYLYKNKITVSDSKPIRVYLDGMLYHNDVSIHFAKSLLHYIKKSISEQPKSIAKILIPKNLDRITDPWQVVDYLNRIRKNGISVHLLFDEIDYVLRASKGTVGTILRSLISQGHLITVATTFRSPNLDDIISPWFNVFNPLRIALFTKNEAIEMLETLSERCGKMFNRNESLLLIDLFGRHPFYLQAVGFQIFSEYEYSSTTHNNNSKSFISAVKQFSKDINFHIPVVLQNCNEEERVTLHHIASGKKNISKFNPQIINNLLSFGLIEQTDNELKFSSKVLEQVFLSFEKPNKDKSTKKVLDVFAGFSKKIFDYAIEKVVDVAIKNYLS